MESYNWKCAWGMKRKGNKGISSGKGSRRGINPECGDSIGSGIKVIIKSKRKITKKIKNWHNCYFIFIRCIWERNAA